MNGLYLSPGGTSDPGWNFVSGKPVGPGTAIRVGLKSGAPAKWMTAGPNGLPVGVGFASVTVCTQAAQPIPILASLGAKLTPKSAARPLSEASSKVYQTVSCLPVKGFGAVPG